MKMKHIYRNKSCGNMQWNSGLKHYICDILLEFINNSREKNVLYILQDTELEGCTIIL